MKMNRKSCALLNLAIAASLFAFAACSDYLEDFQDKYDDGKAFAEISSDSENGGDDGSSDSKLSSSNGGDSELSSSSDDSKLSSSSKGNGDVDSSDSTDSSSSAADPVSSSSVAESSSSTFEPCTGTVIYDASMDSLYGVFGYPFMTEYAELEANSSGVKATMKYAESEYQTLFLNLANSSKNETKDIEAWEGVCIEYSSDGNLSFNLSTPHEQNAYAVTSLPQTKNNKETFTWRWNDIKQKGKAFSINKVGQLVFYSFESTKTITITIHKITTLKPVDLGLSGVYNGLEPVSECSEGSAQIIYNAPETKNVSSWGTNFFLIFTPETNATYNSTKNVLSMSMTAPESYQMNMVGVNQAETKDWGGLCIEYEADHPLFWSVSLLQNIESNQYTWDMGSEATVVLPKTEGIKAYKISWKKFGELKNNSFAGIINAMQFHHDNFDEYHVADKSYNIEDYKATVNLGIQRITSYN